jgi:Fe-S-cluster-containing hydrogenase component 2
VSCTYRGEHQFYIHLDGCIDCAACEPACPVTAIFHKDGAPAAMAACIAKNRVRTTDRPYAAHIDRDTDSGWLARGDLYRADVF